MIRFTPLRLGSALSSGNALRVVGAFACALFVAGIALAQVNAPIQLGESLPRLDIDYVKGSPIIEPDGRTITVVEFWGTWCKPCRMTIPHLSGLQAHYGPAGLQIVGISDERIELVEPFVEQMGDQMEYAVAVDRDRKTSVRFCDPDKGIPQAFLFNELGTLIWIGHPAHPELERLIKELTEELSADS